MDGVSTPWLARPCADSSVVPMWGTECSSPTLLELENPTVYQSFFDALTDALAFEGTATPTGANDLKRELQVMGIIGKV
jgi:hypothetical protein